MMLSDSFKFLIPLLIALAGATAAQTGPAQYELEVNGLACPFCAYGIEKHLLRIDAVEKVEVDVAGGQVVLWVAPGASLTRDQVDRALRDAGFELNEFRAIEPDDPA